MRGRRGSRGGHVQSRKVAPAPAIPSLPTSPLRAARAPINKGTPDPDVSPESSLPSSEFRVVVQFQTAPLPSFASHIVPRASAKRQPRIPRPEEVGHRIVM